jgi:UDP-N-acetylmuramoyl-L-alanyl-D-glutamate--2,6-diaminopimelate ligase
MEVSSHAVALERIHGIDFAVSVFTNLSRDHLDYHKTMEAYFDAKARLFRGMGKEDGHAYVINWDDPWGRRLLNEQPPTRDVVTYGFDEQAMVRASDVKIGSDRTSFRLTRPWGKKRIRLNLPGRYNITNALAALATGGLCGLDPGRMAESMANIQAIPGRLEAIPNRRHRRIFVDYAHTGDALRNVLGALREICPGRLIVVFGCGGNRDRGKRQLMGEAAAALADFSILTTDNPRSEDPASIIGDIVKGFSGNDRFEVELDRRKAVEKGIQRTGRRDILLIAGKGHETCQELKETIIPFDDREVVREILS